MMTTLNQVHAFLVEHGDELTGLDRTLFMSLVCMVLEEWCLKNDENVVEMSKEIAEVVAMVNRDLGKYEGDAQIPLI